MAGSLGKDRLRVKRELKENRPRMHADKRESEKVRIDARPLNRYRSWLLRQYRAFNPVNLSLQIRVYPRVSAANFLI